MFSFTFLSLWDTNYVQQTTLSNSILEYINISPMLHGYSLCRAKGLPATSVRTTGWPTAPCTMRFPQVPLQRPESRGEEFLQVCQGPWYEYYSRNILELQNTLETRSSNSLPNHRWTITQHCTRNKLKNTLETKTSNDLEVSKTSDRTVNDYMASETNNLNLKLN